MNSKIEELIKLLNKMLECSEPIYYNDFNVFINTIDKDKLKSYEEEDNRLGIATWKEKNEFGEYIYFNDRIGISTLSIIATITDVLVEERLGVTIDDEGKIIKFTLYNK